jgi:hypothetical protein
MAELINSKEDEKDHRWQGRALERDDPYQTKIPYHIE